MSRDYKLTRLEMVQEYAERIFNESSEILKSSEPAKTQEFRLKLARFIAKLKKGWMGKKRARLLPENQAYLTQLLLNLNKLDIAIINHILLIERGANLLVSLRKIEAPLRTVDPEEFNTPLDISYWFYSSRLIEELTQAEEPN
jgi:hypothetical protein